MLSIDSSDLIHRMMNAMVTVGVALALAPGFVRGARPIHAGPFYVMDNAEITNRLDSGLRR